MVDAIARRPAPYLAHVVLGHIRSLFNWAINRGAYGLEVSPCDRLKAGGADRRQGNHASASCKTRSSQLCGKRVRIGYPTDPLSAAPPNWSS